MIGIAEVPAIEATAAEVAAILAQSQPFIDALESQLSSNPQFVSQASGEIALDQDFIQTVSDLVAQNPLVIQEIVQTLKTNVTFNTNIATLIGNNPSIQTIIQQNLIDSPLFIQNLIQVLEDEGIGSGGILPQHTVYVSPQWLPEPNPSLPNTHYFTNLADANDFIVATQSSIDEPWAMVIWPGIYDAMNPARSNADDDGYSEALQSLIDMTKARSRIVEMMTENNKYVVQCLKDGSLVDTCIAASKVASFNQSGFDALYESCRVKEDDLKQDDLKSAMKPLAMIENGEIKEEKASSSAPSAQEDSLDDNLKLMEAPSLKEHQDAIHVPSRVQQIYESFPIRSMASGEGDKPGDSTLASLLSGKMHASHRLLVKTLDVAISTLVSKICTKRKPSILEATDDEGDENAEFRAFVPPSLILPLNVHIKAAIPGTVFINSDILLQSDPSAGVGASDSFWNTVSDVNMFDNVIQWDCEQFDYTQAGTPGVAFINCGAISASPDTPDVNIQIIGPDSFPTGSALVPRFHWRNSVNASIRNFSTDQYRGTVQIDNCREFYVSIFDQDTSTLFVNQSYDVYLGTSSRILRSRNNELGNPMNIIAMSSFAQFPQIPTTTELGSFNLQVIQSLWQNPPGQTIQGTNTLSVTRGFLQSGQTPTFSSNTNITITKSYVPSNMTVLANTGFNAESSALLGTISIPPRCSSFSVRDCYISNLEFNASQAAGSSGIVITNSTIAVLRATPNPISQVLAIGLRHTYLINVEIRRQSVELDFSNCVVDGTVSIGISGSTQPNISGVGITAQSTAFIDVIRVEQGSVWQNDPSGFTIRLLGCVFSDINTARNVNCNCTIVRSVAQRVGALNASAVISCGNPRLTVQLDGCCSATYANYDAGLQIIASSSEDSLDLNVAFNITSSRLKLLRVDYSNNPSGGTISTTIQQSLVKTLDMPTLAIGSTTVFPSLTIRSSYMENATLPIGFTSFIAELSTIGNFRANVQNSDWRMFSCKCNNLVLERLEMVLVNTRMTFVCCNFGTVEDNSDLPLNMNNCLIDTYTTRPGPFPIDYNNEFVQYDKTFNHCTIRRVEFSSNYYLVFQHCNISFIIVDLPLPDLPLSANAGALNLLHCIVTRIDDKLAVQPGPTLAYLRLFVKSSQITAACVLRHTPVAPSGISPSPVVNSAIPTFPYSRTDSQGPAIFFESDINFLLVDSNLMVTQLTTQAYTMIRCTVRGGSMTSPAVDRRITLSRFTGQPANSNLLATNFTLTNVDQVNYSMPTLSPLTFW